MALRDKALGNPSKTHALDSRLQELLDDANALRVSPGEIVAAPIHYLDDFLRTSYFASFENKAIQLLREGRIAVELFAAGAATRLNDALASHSRPRRPMYFTDFWEIARIFHENSRGEPSSHRQGGVPLGPRQLIQLAKHVENVAGEKALQLLPLILHVNSDVEDDLVDDLVRRRFYGLNPSNILLLSQPSLAGYTVDPRGRPKPDPHTHRFPYNHGYATMQLAWAGEAFQVDKRGNRRPLVESALDRLLDYGVRFLSTSRVNDLAQLTDKVLDLDAWALSLFHFEQTRANLTVELVENPTGQKGGVALHLRGRGKTSCFLLEGMNARTPQLQRRLKQLSQKASRSDPGGLPYNAFRLRYEAYALRRLLDKNFPLTLRLRHGRLYPEIPTGDITRIPGARAVAMAHRGRRIQDLKTPKDIAGAIPILSGQDLDPSFQKALRRWGVRGGVALR